MNVRQVQQAVASWLASARGRRVALRIGLLVLVLVGALVLLRRTPAVSQPVAFNHRRHTQDLKLDCQLCHQYVTTAAHAGLPTGQTCVVCHQARLGKSPEAARVTELLARGDSLHFAKLFRLPAHVNFTHRRHVGIAKLACEACHGAIAVSQRPPERALVRIRMQFCLDCHRTNGQSLDCVACHR
ncbi:MAG TPA: cytochrome c3 family protein [Gemmatimonadales bacterium]|nr:cytochrome c3 family protein [Gemmatimonadales bacterium]